MAAKEITITIAMSCTEVARPRGGAVRATFNVVQGAGNGSMSIHGPDLPGLADLDPETDYDVTFTPRKK